MTTDQIPEHVLAIPSPAFSDLAEGFTPIKREALELYAPLMVLLPRPAAETDETHRQIISYVLLTCQGRVLTYKRTKQGGDERLHGKVSIGTGGHINPGDLPFLRPLYKQSDELYNTAGSCAVRELCEELDYFFPGVTNPVGNWSAGAHYEVRGLLNDTSNEVGRVHLGIIWTAEVKPNYPPNIRAKCPGLELLGWFEPRSLRAGAPEYQLESWTSLLLPHLETLLANP